MKNPTLNPAMSLLTKLGSIVVHTEEMLSSDEHAFDRSATLSLIEDPEVREWLTSMDSLALLPVRRT